MQNASACLSPANYGRASSKSGLFRNKKAPRNKESFLNTSSSSCLRSPTAGKPDTKSFRKHKRHRPKTCAAQNEKTLTTHIGSTWARRAARRPPRYACYFKVAARPDADPAAKFAKQRLRIECVDQEDPLVYDSRRIGEDRHAGFECQVSSTLGRRTGGWVQNILKQMGYVGV